MENEALLILAAWILVCATSGRAQGNLASPTNVLASSTAGGSTSYIYGVVASDGVSYSVYAVSNSLTTGATCANLSSSPNSVTCTPVATATKYVWYRLIGGVGVFGKFATTNTCAVSDTGASGDGTVPWSLPNAGIIAKCHLAGRLQRVCHQP